MSFLIMHNSFSDILFQIDYLLIKQNKRKELNHC